MRLWHFSNQLTVATQHSAQRKCRSCQVAWRRNTQCTQCSVLMECQCEGCGQGKDLGCIAWSGPGCNKLFVEAGCSGGCLLISVSESLAGSILARVPFWTILDFENVCQNENHKSLPTAQQQQARQHQHTCGTHECIIVRHSKGSHVAEQQPTYLPSFGAPTSVTSNST